METINDYILEKKDLFWSVNKNQLDSISDELLVETILNYGTLEDVKKLFEIHGLKNTSEVFFKATKGRIRHNYFPQVENFFRLYFERHVR